MKKRQMNWEEATAMNRWNHPLAGNESAKTENDSQSCLYTNFLLHLPQQILTKMEGRLGCINLSKVLLKTLTLLLMNFFKIEHVGRVFLIKVTKPFFSVIHRQTLKVLSISVRTVTIVIIATH